MTARAAAVVGVCAVALSGSFAVAFGAGPPTARHAQTVLYRPVGCRVHGPTTAYTSGPARKVVAISFDDGPGSQTATFVSMLEQNRVEATFFMIGEQVIPSFSPTLRRELRDGDALGDHTYTHADLAATTDIYGQLKETIEAIRDQTGYTPCVFRPPFGDYDTQVLQTARSLGLATVLWNVDPSDYSQPPIQTIVDRVLAEVRPGSIIVSHDAGGERAHTLAAYPVIIAALRSRGYRFVTVPQLLGFPTVYRRCRLHCGGTALAGPPPSGSIIEPG